MTLNASSYEYPLICGDFKRGQSPLYPHGRIADSPTTCRLMSAFSVDGVFGIENDEVCNFCFVGDDGLEIWSPPERPKMRAKGSLKLPDVDENAVSGVFGSDSDRTRGKSICFGEPQVLFCGRTGEAHIFSLGFTGVPHFVFFSTVGFVVIFKLCENELRDLLASVRLPPCSLMLNSDRRFD